MKMYYRRDSQSVPEILTKLVSIILEGGQAGSNLSISLRKVSINIPQLIHFNSVKQKRRAGIKHFRHSKKNEPPLPILVGLMVLAKTVKG